MELPAVTVLASKNVNAGAAGAGLVVAAEQRGAVCGCVAAGYPAALKIIRQGVVNHGVL